MSETAAETPPASTPPETPPQPPQPPVTPPQPPAGTDTPDAGKGTLAAILDEIRAVPERTSTAVREAVPAITQPPTPAPAVAKTRRSFSDWWFGKSGSES